MDIIGSLDDNTEIEREGDVMDEHKSSVAHISVSLKELSSPAKPTIKTESKELDVLRRRLADLEANIRRINGKIGTVTPGHSNKQVNVFEMELLDVSHSIATTCIEDAKELPNEKSRISDAIFSTGLKISKLLSPTTEASTKPVREGIHIY